MKTREDTSPTASRSPDPAAEPRGPQFGAGDLVANRYRILRYLARGGMGEVYEAVDLTLDEPIALKTIVADKASRAATVERFKREIQLARKVTHRNVCRIFDVAFHVRGEERDEALVFLTMELLDGETLGDRIRRAGPLAPVDALSIARQIAAALDAAHHAGIVHRDLKSQNVLLTQDRAVVTDFGLARPAGDGGTITHEDQAMLGSPAYMAPEQVVGRTATGAADLYALGVVLFEMTTGTLPFVAETPLSTAAKRLTDAPPRPRDRAPTLDASWEAAILRCLERDPAKRFASAGEVVQALESPRRRRRWPLAVAALMMAAGGIFFAPRRHASLDARPSVAVGEVRNLGVGDTGWIGTALADMLGSELASGDSVRVVPADRVARAGSPQQSGARYLLTGSYLAMPEPGQMRVDLALAEIQGGRQLVHVSETGGRAELFEIVVRAGARLRKALEVPAPRPADTASARSSFPRDPTAARAYAEALDRWRHYDLVGARTLLEKAIGADPSFPLAHHVLSEVLWALEEETRSIAEAQRAKSLSKELPRQEKLAIEAHLAGLQGNWAEAERVHRALVTFYPDDLEVGLALVRAQTEGLHLDDALATITALRRLPGADARLDLAEAEVVDRKHDEKRTIELATRAQQQAIAGHERSLGANATFFLARALRKQGDVVHSAEVARRARALMAELGDHGFEAKSLMELGFAASRQGDLAQGERSFGEAFAIFDRLGARTDAAWALLNVANQHFAAGKLSQARGEYEQVAALDHDIGNRKEEASAIINIASVQHRTGEFAAARANFERALTMVMDVRSVHDEPVVRLSLAELLRSLGDLGGAEAQVAKARPVAFDSGAGQNEIAALLVEGDLLLDRDHLGAARKALEQARDIGERAGNREDVVPVRLSLIRLLLEEGAPGKAAAEARALADDAHAAGMRDEEISAHEYLARAAIERHDLAAAEEAVARASELASKTEDIGVRYGLALARARVEAAAGRTAAARKGFAGVIADAQQRAAIGLALDSRLAQADALQQPSAALAAEARKRGFALIARRAQRQ
jgi:tetratricopeptide (TPR) repeat protein